MKKGLVFFLFCLICEEVFAGVFSVIPTDRSQYYLGMVFGGSVGSISLGGANNPTLSLMFERFNFIIVAIGAVVLSYIGVMTTINTAREGEAMGKKISMWVPLRAFSGMLLMVPGPTSGYSVVQMTVMWIVLNGVGAANAVWEVVLGQLALGVSIGGGLEIKMEPDNLAPLSQFILQSSTCMYTINNVMTELSTNPGPLQNKAVTIYTVTNPPTPAPSGVQPPSITQIANVFVGVQDAPAPYNSLCGYFTVTSTLSPDSALNSFNYATVAQRLQIKTAALQAMFSAVDPAAQILATATATSSPPDPGYVNAAGTAYISQITQLATGIQASAGNAGQSWEQGTAPPLGLSNDLAKLKSYGWIHAGSYYFTMVKSSGAKMDPETIEGQATYPQAYGVPKLTSLSGNNALSPVGSTWPTNDTSPSALGNLLSSTTIVAATNSPETATMNEAIRRAFNYWVDDSNTPGPEKQTLATSKVNTGDKFLDKIVNGIKKKIQRPILKYIQSIASGTTDPSPKDPLVSIGGFGQALLLAAELSVFATMLTSMLLSLALSAASCVSPVAWMINLMLVQILPLIYGLAVMMWTLGATLGIYVPLIPYLVFTTTAFGWMIQVIEAVVAAPIIALGLIHPSGEELGKVSAALPILANIFLRPTLMIFGFVLGISLLRAGIALVNFGFIPAIEEGAALSIFSILVILGMYVALITTIVNKSFSLVYLLPNQIMRWMGGSPESGSPEDMIKETKGGADTGAGLGQKGVSKAYEAAGSKIGDKGEKLMAKSKSPFKQKTDLPE